VSLPALPWPFGRAGTNVSPSPRIVTSRSGFEGSHQLPRGFCGVLEVGIGVLLAMLLVDSRAFG
jgi:hypothetical protein